MSLHLWNISLQSICFSFLIGCNQCFHPNIECLDENTGDASLMQHCPIVPPTLEHWFQNMFPQSITHERSRWVFSWFCHWTVKRVHVSKEGKKHVQKNQWLMRLWTWPVIPFSQTSRQTAGLWGAGPVPGRPGSVTPAVAAAAVIVAAGGTETGRPCGSSRIRRIPCWPKEQRPRTENEEKNKINKNHTQNLKSVFSRHLF